MLRGFVVLIAALLAAGATAATVLTDDPERLRIAVVGALWAFILLALALPRRRAAEVAEAPDTSAAEVAELRRAYEVELEREVAARREYELQLEVYLRRELEQGLAEDVQVLRDDLTRLRTEVLARLDQAPPRDPRTDSVPLPAYRSRYAEPTPYEPYVAAPPPKPPPPKPGPLDEYLRAAVPADDPLGDLPSYGSPRRTNGESYGAPRAPVNGDSHGSPPAPRAPVNGDSYGSPPAPRPPADGEAVPHRRRARSDAEANEVLSRLLGR